MKIIPVIDYLQGNVVQAKLGNRKQYLPIKSKICSNSDICSVLDGILSIDSFEIIYIADLDCIENNQFDRSMWPNICNQYPQVEFWIDIGCFCIDWKQTMQSCTNARPVIGSESYSSITKLSEAVDLLSSYHPLLSIDVKNNTVLGTNNLITSFTNWPKDIILLSLNNVGSNSGPDIDLIKNIQNTLLKQSLYYGGGIRDASDLISMSKFNIKGTLIASSIHNGSINSKDLFGNDM